ncbi:OLC1v1019286C1 [Oldenlandia corymbosa var. corymbosa]|uniref:OLC1v1019286C1 n=1 Tax=Oldenlandia corymbosa var. corymbosa TaxID=529605 RepID=A0AAV1EDI7_OLDCO|nr:OLC1v1019286C1 [Oldenlandia corymbosa var. corymbosa]
MASIADPPVQTADLYPARNLPEELIFEILSRLPAKSLGRFKSVSKPWRSLISSSNFIKTHFRTACGSDDLDHKTIIFKLLLNSPGRFSDVKQCSLSSVVAPGEAFTSAELSDSDYLMKDTGNSFRIVGSCDGFVCISVDDGKDLFLWNPCIKKSKKLRDSYIENRLFRNDVLGFGYDELNDDYKAVRLCVHVPSGHVTEVRVYSLRNDSWRPVGLGKDVLRAGSHSGQYANGNLHWVMAIYGVISWKFLSFDLASETFVEIEWPSSKEGLDDWSVGTLRSCLCVLYDYERSYVDLWIMKEHGVKDSWTKLVSVPYIDLPENCTSSLPICMLSNDDILLQVGSMLVLYSPKSKTFRWYPGINNVVEVSIFTESLLSPYFHDEEQRQATPVN